MKKFLLSLAVMIGLATPAAAAVTYSEETNSLLISGTTTQYQVRDAIKVMDEYDIGTIYLTGPGGDYYAGLKLGRAIRKEGSRVIIPKGKTCISACAFASMGSKIVLNDGELWYHTPYRRAVDPGKTIRELAREDAVAFIDMTEYLYEMMDSDKEAFDFARRIMKDTSPCKFLVRKEDAALEHRDYCK